jgi:hypothetical protein
MFQVEEEALSQPGVEMGSAGTEVKNAKTEKKHEFLGLRQAAIRVLSTAPPAGLTPKEIYDSAVVAGLVNSKRKGKTPWATLAALFYADIKNHKSGDSTFHLVSKGHFVLTDEALSGKITSRSSDATTQKRTIEKKKPAAEFKKFPAPTTDMRGKPLSPNTHAHGKVICNVRQKSNNGTLVCRQLPKHDGEHKFEPYGGKRNKKNKGRRE